MTAETLEKAEIDRLLADVPRHATRRGGGSSRTTAGEPAPRRRPARTRPAEGSKERAPTRR
jgi:hypothetical protein